MAVLFLATSAVLWIVPGNYLHPLSVVINKRDLLLAKRPPRVILMGGSNLLSMRSAVIAGETGRSVINMGIWAGSPVRDVFELIGPDLARGDTVIVVMEYAVLFTPVYTKNIETDRFAFLIRPGHYAKKYLAEGRPLDLVRIFYGIIQIKIKTYLLHAYRGEWRFAADRGSYKYRGSANEYGDRITPSVAIRPLGGRGEIFKSDGRVSLGHLEELHELCRRRGIRMAFCFPPFPREEYERNRDAIASLYRRMKERTRIPVLSEPEDDIYDERFFADTVNHLLPEGEEMRTKNLAGRIKKYLEAAITRAPSPVNVPRTRPRNHQGAERPLRGRSR